MQINNSYKINLCTLVFCGWSWAEFTLIRDKFAATSNYRQTDNWAFHFANYFQFKILIIYARVLIMPIGLANQKRKKNYR